MYGNFTMIMNHPLMNSPDSENKTEHIVINEELSYKSLLEFAQKQIKEQEKKKKIPNYIQEVVETIKKVEYLCDPLGEYHAVISVEDVTHVVGIGSEKFMSYLNRKIYDNHKLTLDPKRVKTCLGIALFDIMGLAKPAKFIQRVAHTDDALYINRGLELPSFIKVDFDTGQREYVSNAPFIPKIKPMETTALDFQKSDGTRFNEFFELMQIDDKLDKLLILSYLTSKMFPDQRGVLLHILGEQGSGKSTLAWAIKNLFDPGNVDTPSEKKDELVQLFDHNALPVLDNLERLSKEFSNTICAMVTGTAYRKRVHYTNDSDFVFNVMNNAILTSIKLPILAKDLISRTFYLKKNKFKKDGYTQDERIRDKILKLQPYCFDELLNLTLEVRKKLIGYEIYGDNRNMDFIAIGRIVSHMVSGDEYIFDEVVQRNDGYITNEALDCSPEALAIIEFMEDKEKYVNTPTNIITDLDLFGCKSNDYHRFPVHFVRRLNHVRDLLRQKGIEVVGGRTHGDHGTIYTFINHNYVQTDDDIYPDLNDTTYIDAISESDYS